MSELQASGGGGRVRRAAALVLWLGVAGALAGGVFGLSFYLAMQRQLRSTEVQVPDLSGRTLEEARAAVAPFDLQLQVVDQRNDPRVSSGRVLEQEPAEGAAVRRGRKIRLILSLGGQVLEVPDLVGQGARAVTIELQQQGFVPGDEAGVPSRESGAGTVIAQVPPAGTPAVPSSRVHRLVSLGPPEAVWVMPDLVGWPRERVESWLDDAGLRRGPVRSVPALDRAPGTVVGQTPLAGYPVRSRDIVELTVAR